VPPDVLSLPVLLYSYVPEEIEKGNGFSRLEHQNRGRRDQAGAPFILASILISTNYAHGYS
jgi:hypothetical protein